MGRFIYPNPNQIQHMPQCNILKGIKPANFYKNEGYFHKFVQKVRPILGNLEEVHCIWSKNEGKEIDAPLMAFTVESWMVEEEKAYGLLECHGM